MSAIAEIKHLRVTLPTREQSPLVALDDINFDLKPGETLALLGESGSGKSITSLALMRLLPALSTYGRQSEVCFAGQDILNLPEKLMQSLRGRRISLIFQEPMTALNPVLTIEQQLSETIRKHQSLTRKDVRVRILQLLHEVEVHPPETYLLRYPHQLSGGQKQRVMIAMALANNPEILIADEPTTALDVTTQAQILALLKRLQQQHQMSLLLITHDLGVVKLMADRVCLMYAGQIVESDTVDEFIHQPLHPYCQQLMVSLPSVEKRGQWLEAIPGSTPALDALPAGCRFHPRCAHAFAPCALNEPKLQARPSGRLVRCHLYPEHDVLPSLPEHSIQWHEKQVSEELLLSVEDLQVYFSKRSGWRRQLEVHKAVDGLSFSVLKGETLALVGESGCGKTTTARALIRLQPISGGIMRYRGQDIAKLYGRDLQQFRRKVQIIFQDPFSSMNPRWTIGEILAEGMQALGVKSDTIYRKQLQLLDQVNLPKTALHRYPHQFSGGQRQRICIARALACEPELLICDEPTSALDSSVQAQILNLLKELQQAFGLSYVFITHNMNVVAYMADKILVMHEGRSVEGGNVEQVLNHPQHPYTQQLLASVLP